MGVATTVTLGGVVYDVYGLTTNPVADADAHLNAKFGAEAWAAAGVDDKRRCLISAARWLDGAAQWKGTKTVSSQALEWPRDGADCNGNAIANGTVPDAVARAEFELAMLVLADSAAQEAETQGNNIQSLQAGPVSLSYFVGTRGRPSLGDTPFPAIVMRLVGCMINNAPGTFSGTGPTAFGTDQESAFAPTDFGLNQGLP